MQLGSPGADPFHAFLLQEAESLGLKKNLSTTLFNYVNGVYFSVRLQVKVRINYHNPVKTNYVLGMLGPLGTLPQNVNHNMFCNLHKSPLMTFVHKIFDLSSFSRC